MNEILTSNDNYTIGTLRFYTQGQIGVSTTSIRQKVTKNAYVSLDRGDAYDTFDNIARRTYVSPNYTAGDLIWVHPKARISRDLIRKSGYAITRDIEKADFIVLPEPDYKLFSDITYHIVCSCNGMLYFFSASDVYNREIPDEKLDIAKDRIKQYIGDDNVVFYCDDFQLKTACFFPQIEEYKNLLEDKYEGKMVVFDTKLQLVPNVEISIETLDVWSRLEDINMVSRFVCASDYKKYPLTVKLFLEEYQYSIKYQSNNNIKMIVKELGIGEYTPKDMVVTPKDYNMMMSWVFHVIGKPVGSTYITEKDWDNIPGSFKKFLKKRFAIAPVVLEHDDIYDNIINYAKN